MADLILGCSTGIDRDIRWNRSFVWHLDLTCRNGLLASSPALHDGLILPLHGALIVWVFLEHYYLSISVPRSAEASIGPAIPFDKF